MSDFGQAVARAIAFSRILANGDLRKGLGAGAHNRAASSVAEAMNFRWLPITSLQSLFAEFVPCLAPEREAGWRTDGAASDYFFDRQLRVATDVRPRLLR
jgi:hypothetical protein